MQHPNFETRHPLQTDEQQETGFDPLNNFNKNRNRGSLDSSTNSQSQSTFLSYRKEWDDLFLNSNYLARIRQAGINGRLRSSRFRSVCWKLYLEALPEDKGQWINKTNELRAQYEKIKETHITNPRKAAGQQDLMVNNPLSQDEGSLWNKFFQDKELKGMIKQDVLRTFPEIRYFQDDDVRTKLTDILFCYARENEQLLYKQGMHELLAPIVFVLHCDHQAFQHASETASPSEEMKCLLNPAYLEHDAYALFSQLMETAEPWFSSYEREVRKGKEEMLTSIPFARPQDSGPSVAIVTKVNRIQDQLVKKHDVELHMHVNRLEIAPQIYGIRWVRLLFGREFPLQDLLVVWDALFADSITLDLVDYIFVAMLLYIRDALIASNFQTCLGLLMHYPPLGDINSLLQKALFLRDPKNYPRPVNYQFQQNLDYYKTRGADLMNRTRSGSSTKPAPLNINKVSSSLLSFGRKLIAPAISGGSGSISPINTEVHSSSSTSHASVPSPTLPHPLAEPPSGHAMPQTQSHAQSQHYRLLKSESMPVHLSKDVVSGGVSQVSLPAQTHTDTQGQRSRTVSSSPSIESLSGGRAQSAASPPFPPSRGSDVSTSSPPLSATKKDSFFNITRSRSHSKTMGKKESEEDLEAQVSFLQGQINDLEAMSKYCARMMNIHICKIQDVILQEHLEKEDEVLVSLAGLKQVKDILKGALRFNQSQLEAEENEEISIADDHYTITAAAETALSASNDPGDPQQQGNSRQSQDSDQDGSESTDEKEEEEQAMTPPEQQVASSLGSEGKNWDDYILVCQDGDLLAAEGGGGGVGRAAAERTPPIRRGRGLVRMEPEGAAGTFHDPLMAGTTSGSSSPDEGSTHSKDSDFTIVNPNEL
ncbi:TBC1 domain family member 5 isoform X1 [Sander lucioperca]|uniref:TBC1 domain family member 5 n=1 Tax=Sander lucioperca TaxID=283035 RepID=A0A8C9Z935_SANLU|nr:TBC1 domain family member 5 isoform X1 [Sander lucioperca]XP_031178838.1 TBC1 domain family member 5 isoform X1 [Sander lucioperca]XP_031178839.1 TBC1 domain family member 5 isoform X1 [Sander lucioperca]XP_031178840.1 TBC1 domain family member 5 isoform X1 [Sander lucioperca]XP_031178841.1 TBC1 domain family member 5 isoform X1 [Sander lucioperca]XP_035848700.1 TBC1 domain family member 5 isoform X1 [Sander lucioperca]XP_035848701.1 TBC1 domain family member 5 isoform X1 [Sander lucioperc